MKIIAARVIVTCPGRNFVTLKIETDEGLYGLGDATLNGRELAVAAYLNEHIVPCLIGRDAHQIEDIWQYLYRGAYWRRGPVTMSAIAAVDTALWDLKAKAAGMPLYQLLGGRSPPRGARVRARERARPSRRPATRSRATRRWATGRSARRAACPGLASTYGVSADKMFYEPADADAADRERLVDAEVPGAHAEAVRGAARALRHRPHLLHDVHHRLTPIEAARLGKALEPYALFWMEDATPAENQAAFRLIRQHTVTPLAVGEVFNTIWDCKQLIEEQLIDYIRTTVVHAGGITHLKRIADFASLSQVRTGCHGATDLSPVCMGASLHLNTALPNFGIQEYMRHTQETDAVFPHAYFFKHGGRCIRARASATGWISTRSWRRSTRTGAPTCR